MSATTSGLRQRIIAYLLHVGCVEIRSLALGGAPHNQIAELADALEILPRFLDAEPTADDWELVRFVVENYNAQFPESGWRLAQRLDQEPPERY
jgi:hypothetical protein